ncbi:putative bifunctional diguanylate cyclase/phosphodiesterase [Arthrobacter bambusae]|uniref:putative bifunctional diguanylate cyclase/phosphodiesterase n=1 Tax=Arthrobacter bambusae TaxID=1338426 RepID=UPI002788273C|nr:EAL domain-containing protein [Arthrobacter bambusae]MDQ0029355.1 diguanylate cyclase (GGDEF)-like protein [Arthrobacter bambusae]MDQ0097015.1 diguanylate cyclase (GGDEF)-like protein [Arthrobacter bambusae]
MRSRKRVEDARLQLLVDGVVRLAAGDLDARIEPSAERDEIDAVITGVNLLAEELGHIHADLEQRVATRTAMLRQTQVELERMAKTDALTGLPNRTLLTERIQEAVLSSADGGKGPAVLLLDLDSFKAINDILGHNAGDAALVEVAKRLRSAVRASDTVARLGGDEFAILIDSATEDEVLHIAHRASESLQESVRIGAETVWAMASIGVCIGKPGYPAEALLRDADIAMYRAKARGRNNVQIFHPDMLDAVQERSRITAELRTAVAGGELALLYQPVVELASGGVIGMEALLRWHHPVRGTIMPGSFIGIAEETGLIFELGRWVLHEGLAQMRRWRQTDPDLADFRLHINLSAAELLRPDLLDDIRDTLARNGVDPRHLVLEITETVLMSRGTGEEQVLSRLRELGVGLQIDDFGTGFSSISYLTALPADTVKVDQSLIRDLESNPRQQKFVSAILQLIFAAGLNATVEGIETAEQAAQLTSMGCLYGQGYFYGRPLPAAQLAGQLRRAARHL